MAFWPFRWTWLNSKNTFFVHTVKVAARVQKALYILTGTTLVPFKVPRSSRRSAFAISLLKSPFFTKIQITKFLPKAFNTFGKNFVIWIFFIKLVKNRDFKHKIHLHRRTDPEPDVLTSSLPSLLAQQSYVTDPCLHGCALEDWGLGWREIPRRFRSAQQLRH